MRIEQWDPADETTAMACYEVYLAVHLADEAGEPPMSAGTFGLFLREGFDKTPAEVWFAADDEAGVAGYYRMHLWDLENLDRAFGGPMVHPAMRRRGYGRALLLHEAERAAANGRSMLASHLVSGSAGEAFAIAAGATSTLVDVRRVQYLAKIEPGKVAELRESAARAAAGYSLVTWEGDVPEQYQAPLAHVINAFEDAPRGENVEPEAWDAARVRDRTGAHVRAGLLRNHSVAALHDATGEMAAYTGMIVDPEAPTWGFQELTAVTRDHRGHRLGLLVKTAMLELLAEAEPQVEYIQTGNAAANDHMIAVNEQLGYEVVEPGWQFYEAPVSTLLDQS
ncbi:MAG TPA: GNAT family N-acetyltransferase [Trebonia sp.]|jgi:GNAT superfamily N-acetyltransferase|nr:GNAT family N-acetyltransferase [Trebonia sp.]